MQMPPEEVKQEEPVVQIEETFPQRRFYPQNEVNMEPPESHYEAITTEEEN